VAQCFVCSLGDTVFRYEHQGKHDKAIECGEKALAIRVKVLGEDHPDVATSCNNLGNV
jgi:hypothetical protein